MKHFSLQLRTFIYGGVTYPYELYVGGVKRLNLRIRPDGTIRVSIPMRCREETLERFLLHCAPRIAKTMEQRQTASSKATPPRDAIRYLGSSLPLTVEHIPCGRAVCHADDEASPTRLSVTVAEDAAPSDIEASVIAWQKEKLIALLQEIHHRVIMPTFASLSMTDRQRQLITQPPSFRLRLMKSRWGSCNIKTGAMTYNLALLSYPLSCIEYVMVHEFAHLLQPDHSPAYHALMDDLLPDWKARRALLK